MRQTLYVIISNRSENLDALLLDAKKKNDDVSVTIDC